MALDPQVAFPVFLSICSGMGWPLGQAGCGVVVLMGHLSRSILGCCHRAWSDGEGLRFGELLGKDEAQAKEAAATISSSLGEGWVFSLPPAALTSAPFPSSACFFMC